MGLLFVSMRFQDLFRALSGFFSTSFPHGTGSLSVDYEYLALRMVPIFRQDFSCPAPFSSNLVPHVCFRIQGCHLLWRTFHSVLQSLSLEGSSDFARTTAGISFDVFSSSYLRCFSSIWFAFFIPVFSMRYLCEVGFHSEISRIKSLFAVPKLIAAIPRLFVACNRQGIHHML